jgi:hypothetical protein
MTEHEGTAMNVDYYFYFSGSPYVGVWCTWYSPTGYFCGDAEDVDGRYISVVILLPLNSL